MEMTLREFLLELWTDCVTDFYEAVRAHDHEFSAACFDQARRITALRDALGLR